MIIMGNTYYFTDVAELPPRMEYSRVGRTAQSACGGASARRCEYTQILLLAFVQNIEMSKISPKHSKISKSQKMQKIDLQIFLISSIIRI